MRMRDFTICSVSLILAAALFFAAGTSLDSINRQRRKLNLIIEKPQNVPPSIAFATVATGAFRGLLVDALWIRAEKLKQQDQFYDAKQLAEWISVLQPRFIAVWEFLSWNMAYNISVSYPATEPQERWRWVQNGYELIRDKAIPLNPKSIALYKQMAFIFQHKIGGITDDVHNFYKLQLANEMTPLLGPANNKYYEELAKAPLSLNELAADIDLTGVIEQLRALNKAFSEKTEEFVSAFLIFRQNPQMYGLEATWILENPENTDAMDKLNIFVNAYQLRNTWKLDPQFMLELNQKYGPVPWDDPNTHLPLEWRHPDAHALYWLCLGSKIAGREEFSPDEANTDRLINHSLQNLYRYGKIYIYIQLVEPQSEPFSDSNSPQILQAIYLRPDYRMFGVYDQSTRDIIEKYKPLAEMTAKSMSDGHRNLLEGAVMHFYLAGHKIKALQIFSEMKSLYERDEFNVPFEVYVRNKFEEDLREIGINEARLMIQSLLQETYFRYAMLDDDMAAQNENIARQVYDIYNQLYPEAERLGLSEFDRLKYNALFDFYTDESYPKVLRDSLVNRIQTQKPELYEQLIKQEEKILQENEQSQVQQ